MGRTVCHSSTSSSMSTSVSIGVRSTPSNVRSGIGGGSRGHEKRSLRLLFLRDQSPQGIDLVSHRPKRNLSSSIDRCCVKLCSCFFDLFKVHLLLFLNHSASALSKKLLLSQLLSHLEKSSVDMTLWKSLSALIMSFGRSSFLGRRRRSHPSTRRASWRHNLRLFVTHRGRHIAWSRRRVSTQWAFVSPFALAIPFQYAGASMRCSPHRKHRVRTNQQCCALQYEHDHCPGTFSRDPPQSR